ncbi:hypothetical protein DV737_g958, partial [Chaetothyriales sp. CBS 132003]
MANDESDALDALEKEAKEYDKDAEIDRILKAFRLDAYAVLDLQPGVPDSDIKIVYRKKSLLIHPDKTKNPQAPEAFDRLKKAQTALLDEAQRKHLDECIADARLLLMRQHKYTVDSDELKTEEFKQEWRRKTIEVLVDAEARRRRQIKAKMQEEGREKAKEEAEIEERKRKRDHDKKWEESREQRIDNWRDALQPSMPPMWDAGPAIPILHRPQFPKSQQDAQIGPSRPATAGSKPPPPPLPIRKLPPPLPARKDSSDSERRPSVESSSSAVTSGSDTSRSAASRSTSSDRIKAPAWGECDLPALPPRGQASQPRKFSAERPKYVNRAPSSENTLAVTPATTCPPRRPSQPPLPPRLPSRKGAVGHVQAEQSPQPQDSVKRPDISAIQATKPKSLPKPTTLKSPGQSGAPPACLVCRDFSLADSRAAQFPRHGVSSLQDLAYHLTNPFPSATDKARAICTWLHLNIAYDVDNFFRGTVKSSSPESTLQSGLAVCEGYAHLLTRLATYAGLDSVVIGGHGKGFGYAPLAPGSALPPFQGNHAWNAVRIDGGEWKLVDSCWYSGHIQGRGMPYVAKRNDSMFTMTNEEFGIKHFPNNKDHFFLQGRPAMTWEEYIQINPDHWPHNVQPPTIYTIAEEQYFVGKQTVAPQSKHISIRQGGNVRFQFGLRCPHWDLAKHTKLGPPPVFLMQIEGLDGRNQDLIPFEHRPGTGNGGDLWYVDLPAIELGAPGQTVSCFAITTFGHSTDCRGLSVAEFRESKGRIGMGFTGVIAWELVA